MPEGREKLSQLAKKRHREGSLGTNQLDSRKGGLTGGRGRDKRKTRITKRVAEAAEDEQNAKAIIEVFRDAIHPNQPMSIRLKGAETWARIAADHHKTEVAEKANEEVQHSREELIEILRGKLTNGPTGQIIMGQLESETGIMDVEVVEEPEEVEDGDGGS